MTEIAGKVAFVTGGGSGIGRGLAVTLAQEGAAVVVADILLDRAEDVAAQIRADGGKALAVVCDVTDRASIRAAHQQAISAFGKVLLLFANAGATAFDAMNGIADGDLDWMLEVNFTSVAHCIQVFLPDMIEAGEGHIMATSSMAGLIPDLVGDHAPYAGAKLGVVGLMLGLRCEIGELGVGATVLCPGGVTTQMRGSGGYRPDRFGGPFERTKGAPASHKVNLFRQPEQVARMVLEAVRKDRPIVVTDNAYREVFLKQYVDPVLQAFDAVADFDEADVVRNSA